MWRDLLCFSRVLYHSATLPNRCRKLRSRHEPLFRDRSLPIDRSRLNHIICGTMPSLNWNRQSYSSEYNFCRPAILVQQS
jgi:hypothetical protein